LIVGIGDTNPHCIAHEHIGLIFDWLPAVGLAERCKRFSINNGVCCDCWAYACCLEYTITDHDRLFFEIILMHLS
jgi:hypothetical protein